MSWINESDRPKHLLYAIPIGLVFTILAVIGGAIGQLLQIIIILIIL